MHFRLLAGAGLLLTLVLAASALVSGAVPANAGAGLSTEDLTGAVTPDDLANDLVGQGITISNVTYTGANEAAGRFSGGTGIIGFDSGIILSSGCVGNVVGPNAADDIACENGTSGDTDLDGLATFQTFDAAVLDFDFVPSSGQVAFQYVFASDEYNEFVNTEFNDVFAFLINGTNCAVVNGDPVSINTINNGNPDPGEDPTATNAGLFINNDLDNGGGSIDTEMDGLTEVLTCQSAVNAGATNHIKLAIADSSDEDYDSDVFLQAGSFEIVPTPTSTGQPTSTPLPATPAPTATPRVAQLPETGLASRDAAGAPGWLALLAAGAGALAVAGGGGYALGRRRRR